MLTFEFLARMGTRESLPAATVLLWKGVTLVPDGKEVAAEAEEVVADDVAVYD